MPESVWEWSTTASSNSNSDSAIGMAEGMLPGGVNNGIRALMAAIKKLVEDQGGKASTTGSSNAYVLATQADVDALADGVQVAFVANHANTGAATLAVDGLDAKAIRKGADVALESGDIVTNAHYLLQYDASANSAAGAWMLLNPAMREFSIAALSQDTTPDQDSDFVATYDTSASAQKKVLLKNVGVGRQTIFIPASAMRPKATNGATFDTLTATNNEYLIARFDPTTEEFMWFHFAAPKSWDEGTITFQVYWTHGSTTTNFGVTWALQGVAMSNDDTLGGTLGTEITVDDTGGTASDLYISPESSALTIGGTPAEGDLLQFLIKRKVDDASDTMVIDAQLVGVRFFYTIDANTDD